MINAFINEIEKCIEQNLYMASLSLSLILIDMCSKAEYPNEINKIRYPKWFDKYISDSMKGFKDKEDGFYVNGQIAYDLRNCVLHEGNPDLKMKDSNVQKFELLVEDHNRCSHMGTETLVISHYENGEEKIDSRQMTISLLDFCEKVIACVKDYYNKNINKFDFKYKVVNISESNSGIFGVEGLNRFIYKK